MEEQSQPPGRKRKRGADNVKPAAKSSAKPKKAEKQPEEKRLRRFRAAPPVAFGAILERATTQRFYVLDRVRTKNDGVPEETVKLAGSTGNIYTVNIGLTPTCNCPHALKGHQCKHSVFVLHRVLRAKSEFVYQLALLSSELREIFDTAPPILAPRKTSEKPPADEVDDAVSKEEKERRKPFSDCPICFEDLTASEPSVWCRAACGQNLHTECFQRWAVEKRRTSSKVTCPYCRSVWMEEEKKAACVDEETAVEAAKNLIDSPSRLTGEGYVNVAGELGISGRRDASSYSRWYGIHQRRRFREAQRSWEDEDPDDL